MGNEKYLNHYIEILTSTMTDCVIRNVSMQANAKIIDEVVKEQTENIEALVKSNGELNSLSIQYMRIIIQTIIKKTIDFNCNFIK